MKKFNSRFPFFIRQAVVVATRVAETTLNYRPVLMTVNGKKYQDKNKMDTVSVHFEGGTTVVVSLYNLTHLKESWRTPRTEEWVVVEAVVFRNNGQPSEIWDATKLFGLKEKNWWHHPHVKDVDEIQGLIGVFWDQDDEKFFIRTDPDYYQEGGDFLNHNLSRPYRPLVEGDKETVIAAIKQKIK